MSGYSREQWEQARTLVVRDGLPYADVAEMTGIGLSSLQKRGARENWQSERKDRAESREDYHSNIFALKSALLDKAVRSKDPQDVHAWNVVERAFPEHRYADLDAGQKKSLAVYVAERLVDYLGGVDTSALESMRPHLRPFSEALAGADWQVGLS
jgi:hypothetical protein